MRAHQAAFFTVTCSGVRLTCMAGLLLDSPPVSSTSLSPTRSIPPSLPPPTLFRLTCFQLHPCASSFSIHPVAILFVPSPPPPPPPFLPPPILLHRPLSSSLTIQHLPSLHPSNHLILSLLNPRAPPSSHPRFPFSILHARTHAHIHRRTHTYPPILLLVPEAAAAVTQRCSPVCRRDHYATSPTPLEYWWAAGWRQQRDSQ